MKFSVFQISRRGGREKNEDRMGYCYTRESGLFVLADGMGGHPEGEVAAQIALQKELSREGERRYTKLTVAEKMRLQLDTLVADTKKNVQKVGDATGLALKPK